MLNAGLTARILTESSDPRVAAAETVDLASSMLAGLQCIVPTSMTLTLPSRKRTVDMSGSPARSPCGLYGALRERGA